MKLPKIKNPLTTLPLNRLLIYLMILGVLPLIFAGFHYAKKKKEWEEVSQQILRIHHISTTAARKQSLNTIVRRIYSEADQFYLENQLETMSFLKKEGETLQQLLKSPTFTGNEAAEKRYAYLTSHANQFEWIQGSVQTVEGIQECDTFLAHPVEIDALDLKEILLRIEGNRKGKPQLIITDFKLNKKALSSGNEVFELNMKLLKREFHS
jgi:hypothetical protein